MCVATLVWQRLIEKAKGLSDDDLVAILGARAAAKAAAAAKSKGKAKGKPAAKAAPKQHP